MKATRPGTTSPLFLLRPLVLLASAAVSAGPLSAASFAVPPDRLMVQQATAIVVASALSSRTQLRNERSIETVTVMSVEQVLKGSIDGDTFDLHEPGGVYEHRATVIPGVPGFKDGDRYLLFLLKTTGGWRVLNLMLGKFSFDTDILGHDVLIRDESEPATWDADHTAHIERQRLAEPFLQFLRGAVSGGPAKQDYLVPSEPLVGQSGPINTVFAQRLKPVTNVFTANSYTFIILSPSGARWQSFPVTFKSVGSEPGAPGSPAGATAISNSFTSWNGEANSNINYMYAGDDLSGTHTGGLATPDGQNTIAFERDLAAEYGAPGFTCSGSGYSGLLGIGGFTSNIGTHTGPNGETFFNANEGDVEMNIGIANCTFPNFFTGDFNSAVTHEVGHTLGFRHPDKTRALPDVSTACSTDPSLECATSAIMKSFIPSGLNAVLQTWDQNAAAAVYPNPAISPPTGVVATATTANNVQISWTLASGATSYHIYRSSSGLSFSQLPVNPAASTFNDTTAAAGIAYLYMVRSFNGSSESANSNIDLATTVIFTDTTLTVGTTVVRAVHFTELRTAVNAVQTLAGTTPTGYTDPTLNSTVNVKKVHIDEPLTRVNAARTTLGLSTISLSGGAITPFITPVRASDVNDLRGGVR